MLLIRSIGTRRSRRGTALVLIAMALIGLAGLSATLLMLTHSGSREQRQDREKIHARYVCLAGISAGMFNLQRGLSGAIGTQSSPASLGKAQYWVTQTNVTSDVLRLLATGRDSRETARMELVVRRVPTTIWRFGAFGDEHVHLDSNARVDSYDSSLGSYDSQALNGSGSTQHASTNGDVGSNGSISMDQNSKVWGDAVAGPSHTTTVLGNAVVTGSTSPASQPLTMPSISLPSFTSYGALTVSGTTTIPASNRTYSNITVGSNKTLNITGPATIVMNNLTLKSGASVWINAANGPVTLWVIDNFVLNSNAQMASTDFSPSKLRINLLSDNVLNPELNVQLDTVDFNSNTKLFGTIYAPHAAITINSNFAMYGSMIARSIDLRSNATFHYDENLINATSNGVPTYETICWRELAGTN